MKAVGSDLIFSYDVFDTVITRSVAKPTDVFYLLRKDLLESGCNYPDELVNNFEKIRINAEKTARNLSVHEDIKIDEIYSVIAKSFELPETHKQSLIASEIKKEIGLFSPIATTIKDIQFRRNQGYSIIFVSDMYLPKEVIIQVLTDYGAYSEPDCLFLSSDIGLSKATGNLYKYIINHLRCKPEQLIHYGDNIRSDIKIPEKLGIKINNQIDQNLEFSAYEKSIYRKTNNHSNLNSTLAGVSRACRLSGQFDDDNHKKIWDVSSNIIGPAFYFFINWVLNKARAHGIDCLYFMARDGHILYKIARTLEEKYRYGLELKYLYVSRESLLIPAISQIMQFDMNWLITYLEDFSIKSVTDTLNIRPDDISGELVKYGFQPDSWDDEIPAQKYRNFLSCFLEKNVKSVIARSNRDNFSDALGYFMQEGMSRSRKFAVVDVGWQGHGQLALSSILSAGNQRPEGGINGYYFGFGRKMHVFPNDNVYSFCADNNIRKVLSHYSIFEIFASTDHGKTIGYKSDNNRFSPILNFDTNSEAIAWGVCIQQRAILKFCRLLADTFPENLFERSLVKTVLRTGMLNFSKSPTLNEAEVYGSHPFSCYLKEKQFADVAPKLSRHELWSKFLKKEKVVSLWFPGTFVRSRLYLEKFLWDLNVWRRNFQSYIRVRYGRQKKIYFNRSV